MGSHHRGRAGWSWQAVRGQDGQTACIVRPAVRSCDLAAAGWISGRHGPERGGRSKPSRCFCVSDRRAALLKTSRGTTGANAVLVSPVKHAPPPPFASQPAPTVLPSSSGSLSWLRLLDAPSKQRSVVARVSSGAESLYVHDARARSGARRGNELSAFLFASILKASPAQASRSGAMARIVPAAARVAGLMCSS